MNGFSLKQSTICILRSQLPVDKLGYFPSFESSSNFAHILLNISNVFIYVRDAFELTFIQNFNEV